MARNDEYNISQLAYDDMRAAGFNLELNAKPETADGATIFNPNIEVKVALATQGTSAVRLTQLIDEAQARAAADDALQQSIDAAATAWAQGDATTLADANAYADGKVQSALHGVDWKESVKAAATGNFTLSTGPLSTTGDGTIVIIDGVHIYGGDRVLFAFQTDATQNGIYFVTAGNGWQRTFDADADTEVSAGLTVYVEEGTQNQRGTFRLSSLGSLGTGRHNIGSDTLTFTRIFSASDIVAGNGLEKNGNTLSFRAGGGLYAAGTVGVSAGEGIKVDGSGVGIKLNGSSSGLYTSGFGVGVQLDGTTLGVSSGGLKVNATNVLASLKTEVPTLVASTAGKEFQLADTPATILQVHKGRLLQMLSVDYTVNSGGHIVFAVAPLSTEVVTALYVKA